MAAARELMLGEALPPLLLVFKVCSRPAPLLGWGLRLHTCGSLHGTAVLTLEGPARWAGPGAWQCTLAEQEPQQCSSLCLLSRCLFVSRK